MKQHSLIASALQVVLPRIRIHLVEKIDMHLQNNIQIVGSVLVALVLNSGCVGPKSGRNSENVGRPFSQPAGSVEPDSGIRYVTVARHLSAEITDSEADAILGEMSRVLSEDDGGGDVPVNLQFIRRGAVQVFSDGDGSIDDEAEFNAILSVAGTIKVVKELNWCANLNPHAIGCAPAPGDSMVVERNPNLTLEEEGILWAHEYGHNKGLDHREADRAVMRDFVAADHRRIDVNENEAFAKKSRVESSVLMAAGGPSVPVEKFVRRFYIHGVPVEEARKYGPADAKKLLTLLKDDGFERYRENVIATLAYIGGPDAVSGLIGFIKDTPIELSSTNRRAVSAAIVNLGSSYERTRDPKIIGFLGDLVSSAEKRNMCLPWSDKASSESLNRVSSDAIWGLAFTGADEARAKLSELANGSGRPGGLQAAVSPQLKQAQQVLDVVAEKGLGGYQLEAKSGNLK